MGTSTREVVVRAEAVDSDRFNLPGNCAETPSVSIVTPMKNALPYVRETAKSVLEQSYRDFEWIVVDDGSVDGSADFVRELARADARVRLDAIGVEESHGAGPARNRGLDLARGRFVAFVDADDCWAVDKLARQLQLMENADVAFSFTSYEVIDENGLRTGRVVDSAARDPVDYRTLLRKSVGLGCSTVMIRRNTIGETRFRSLRTGQDYVFWLTLLRQGARAHLIPKALTQYRVVPGSLSRNKWRRARQQWQIYRHVEALSFSRSLLCFVSYAYGAILRRSGK